MTRAARIDGQRRRGSRAKAAGRAVRRPAMRFEGSFEAALLDQDAPRAWIASNCFLAMTRLARPNRLNSCASFLARPL